MSASTGPYLRPIVRGKENKRLEFGAKVNNIQIDGISFIEHHSFEAFNEGIRLRQCIEYQESLTGIRVSRILGGSVDKQWGLLRISPHIDERT